MLTHQSNQKPNVLLILTDQQRYDAVGYINPAINTPNIDALARTSVVCTQAVVQSPQCQPSRASLLTGRYPTAFKMWWNEQPLDLRERTIGNILRDNGYRTGYFGKMHVDGKGGHTKIAKHFGFDDTFLYTDWAHLLIDGELDTDGFGAEIRKEFYHPMSNEPSDGHGPWVGRFSSRDLHHEDVITKKAIKFLQNNSHSPYFCMIGFHGPHPPYAAPPPYDTMYDPASLSVPELHMTPFGFQTTPEYWRDLKSQYYGCISWIDDNIGQILEHVDNNTIVIFSSDHGDILGDHGLFSKGLYAYDGNVRVPLLIRFPSQYHAEYAHTVQTIDILPTILGCVGVEKPAGVQGLNLCEVLKTNQPLNEWAFSCIGFGPRLRMVRTPEFKYWWYDGEYLFDLRGDPSESENIASTHKDLLAQMRAKLITALIKAEDCLPAL